ncbi:MAG TPA: SHOCT domain-containing protein [Solirubrobacteraceae bacterium]
MSAGYLLRGLLGVVLAAASVVIASITIYHLVRTGSCASGGPYLSARPCPEGTGWRIVMLIGSIFVLAPISVVVFGSRAKSSAGGLGGLIGLLWTMGWIAMGSASWVAGHGPGAPVDGGEGSTAVAITFWGIGGVSLLFVVLALAAGVRTARSRPRPSAARRSPPPPPRPAPVVRPAPPKDEVDDVARRLKQLDELKALGAVTDAEYTAKRREILGEI